MSELTDRLRALADQHESRSNQHTAGELREAADELDRMEGIVAKLPTTAGGVPVVPGLDKVWFVHAPGVPHEPVWETLATWRLLTTRRCDCYSTREAAEKARDT